MFDKAIKFYYLRFRFYYFFHIGIVKNNCATPGSILATDFSASISVPVGDAVTQIDSGDINGDGPHIIIKEISFPFSMREAKKRIPPEKNSYSSTYLSTGILVLKIGESFRAQEWKDGSIKLENQIAKIVAKLEIDADKEIIRKEESRIRFFGPLDLGMTTDFI